MDYYNRFLSHFEHIPYAETGIAFVAMLLVAAIASWLTRQVLLRVVQRIVKASPTTWDDALLARGVLSRLAHAVPALIISGGITLVPGLSEGVVAIIQNIAQAYVVLTLALSAGNLLNAVGDIYSRNTERAQAKPIKGYLQVIKIVVFVLAAISIFATLANAPFVGVLTGLGAMTAVTMLIFQDTILSFVAAVQIGSDGRVRVGDWIEMPAQNADGDVIDIALHTVTVQNWDKTITTVPTKKLISESFKNWRGMTETGGRRIKRALYLDQKSVRFLQPEEIARLRRFELLDGYLDEKGRELDEWNAQFEAKGADLINSRRVTNLGTFRAYVERYLRSHPGIHQELSLMVRQLDPGQTGLPLELYCFTSDIRWAMYESIQADIFDHLLAILPEFGLRVFQASSDAPIDVRLHQALAGTDHG